MRGLLLVVLGLVLWTPVVAADGVVQETIEVPARGMVRHETTHRFDPQSRMVGPFAVVIRETAITVSTQAFSGTAKLRLVDDKGVLVELVFTIAPDNGGGSGGGPGSGGGGGTPGGGTGPGTGQPGSGGPGSPGGPGGSGPGGPGTQPPGQQQPEPTATEYHTYLPAVVEGDRKAQARQERTVDAVYSSVDDHAVQALSQLGRAAAWAQMQYDEWQRAQGIDGFQFPGLDLSAKVEEPPPQVAGAPPPPPPGPPAISAAAMTSNAQSVAAWVDDMRRRLPALYLGPLAGAIGRGINYDQAALTNLRLLVRDSNLPETSEAWFDPIVRDRSLSENGEREGKYGYSRASSLGAFKVVSTLLSDAYRNAKYGDTAVAVVQTLEADPNRDLTQRLNELRRRLRGADPRVPILVRELVAGLTAVDTHAEAWKAQPALELPDDLWLTAADLAQPPDCLAAISILTSVVAHEDGPPDSPMRVVPLFRLAGAGRVLLRVTDDLDLVQPVPPAQDAGATAKTIQDALAKLRQKRAAIGAIAAKIEALAVIPKVGEDPHRERRAAAVEAGKAARQLLEQLDDIKDAGKATVSGEVGMISVPTKTRGDGLVLVTSVADIQSRLRQATGTVSGYTAGFIGAGELAFLMGQERYRLETLIGFYEQKGVEYRDVPCDRTFRARMRWDRGFCVEGMGVAIQAHRVNELDNELRSLAMQLSSLQFGTGSPKEGASPATTARFAGLSGQALLTLAEACLQYRLLAILVAGEQASMRADAMVPGLEAARAAVGFRPPPVTAPDRVPDPVRALPEPTSTADPLRPSVDAP